MNLPMSVITEPGNNELAKFVEYLSQHRPLFGKSLERNYHHQPQLFEELGSLLMNWAKRYLGDDYFKVLSDGYASFVIDVNKSQIKYEARGHYTNKTYAEVYDAVYNSDAEMNLYHWGVYVTTFAWQHHLDLYAFFRDYFVRLLAKEGRVLDLGCGSGIWSLLLSTHVPGWQVKGVDISPRSVALSSSMARMNGFSNVDIEVSDALQYRENRKFDACMSCFLLEHLEAPGRLLENLGENLEPGGYAFVTGALTAAEVDHIYEFSRESDLVLLAEQSGFRVIATFSAAPESHPRQFRFLPRSMGLVLQKRTNDIW